MGYNIIITLLIQYSLGMLGRTTETTTFGVWSLIMHFVFVIQTIAVLYLIYMYILNYNAQNVAPETRSLINTVKNLVLFLSGILIILNIIIIFFIDKLKDIFNIF